MSEQNKKLVEAITPINEDFAQWYTDICKKAELVDYSSVKGCVILRPYGYAIWENIQHILDGMFKATGHQNVAMPLFIPESLLQKEKDHVEGFAPEVRLGDGRRHRAAGGAGCGVRPTSETLFCDHFAHVLQSYRDLPLLYNQWCSVVRWEKTTRPFLRSREFWWQEGHTIHETAEEAIAETEQQLNCYADFCENYLKIPVVKGRKTDSEKFSGAEATYTIEAMMHDGKALQSGTSHYFGDGFSRAFNVTFAGRDNKLQYPFQTSWGDVHPDRRRDHHDPRRRRGADPAARRRPDPDRHRADRAAQARRAGKGRGAAGAAGEELPGPSGQLGQLPGLEVQPVRDEGGAAAA